MGGTTLQTNGGTYASETAWSDNTSRTPTGSGGGLSSKFSKPSYQVGPGVTNGYSNGMRQVPDVAANADPATGYAIYAVTSRNGPGWGVMGGTSASAPIWAGFAALVNGALGGRTGIMNPILYELGQKASTFDASPFHDITQGTNLYYPSTSGWDFATGWGAFDGAAFVTELKTLPLSSGSGTSPSSPTSTPTLTPAPTPAATSVLPTLNIKKVLLLHKVAGKLVPTATLKVGEKGTLVILYVRKNAGSYVLSATVSLRKNGQVVRAIAAKKSTYKGQAALEASVQFTSAKRAGILLAHVTLALGSVTASLNRTFKLAAGK